MNTDIRSANLRFVVGNREEVLAWVEGMTPSERSEVSPEWLARVRESTLLPDPWLLGFTIVHRATEEVVGSCGYKGPPDSDGMVEIAYGIHAPFRGRGYATEAARALTTFAFRSGHVKVVRAHTKPDGEASARVLVKSGFQSVGEVLDPEDGLVRRWELRAPRTERDPTLE
jgi:RimJ/RimL family protein N-acetyltransferase